MRGIKDLAVKIFADGAAIPEILALAREPYVRGFTTNPTLMRKAGVTNFQKWNDRHGKSRRGGLTSTLRSRLQTHLVGRLGPLSSVLAATE